MAQPNAILTGLMRRCPHCGEGKLLNGYLAVASGCAACGLDFSFADSGDGPAVFVIFLVAPLVLIMALVTGSLVPIAPWMHLVLWMPATLILCGLLLPPFKGVMVNLQYRHDAHEGHQ